jgi:hypothetical protein
MVLAMCLMWCGSAWASGFVWSAPERVLHSPLYGTPTPLVAVSCPSMSLCVAVDRQGDLVISTRPTAGLRAWKIARVRGVDAFRSVSCASVTLCVAVDGAGDVLSTNDPLGPTTSWRKSRIDPGGVIVAISCPSRSLCVAVDRAGHVLSSTRPNGGSTAWKVSDVDVGRAFVSLSCPSTTLCIAADSAGRLISSKHPAEGARAWVTATAGVGYLIALSCPSVRLCVAADGASIASSTDPMRPASWRTTGSLVPPELCTPSSYCAAYIARIACASAVFCVAVDNYARVLTSTDPAGGTNAWVPEGTSITGLGGVGGPVVGGVSCPSVSLCVAVTDAGAVDTSRTPATGGWQPVQIDGNDALTGITCAQSGLCITYDGYGHAAITNDPFAGAGAWHPTTVGVVRPCTSLSSGCGDVLAGLDCPATSLCVGFDSPPDGQDHILVSRDPLGGSASWKAIGAGPPYELIAVGGGVSCPSISLCVVTDWGDGYVLSSTHPSGSLSAWNATDLFSTTSYLGSVSCPTRSFCVALGYNGSVVTSTDPTGGASAWTAAPIAPAYGLQRLTCPSKHLCVAAGISDAIATSTRPAGGSKAWRFGHANLAGETSEIVALACPSTSLCLAIDANGNLLTSARPAGGAATWKLTTLRRVHLDAITCPSASTCLAADNTGDVLIGRRPRRNLR